MKKLLIWSLFLALLAGPLAGLLAQDDSEEKEKGKLGQIEDEVKDDDDVDDDDGQDDFDANRFYLSRFFWEVSGRLAYGVLIYFPREDSTLYSGNFGNTYYSDYPYVDRETGLFGIDGSKRFSVHFSGHYFHDEAELTGRGFRARFSPSQFFSSELHFTDLSEKLATRTDHLKLYSVFINYNRLRLDRWALWWGLGMKGLRGDETFNGVAFNTGTEIYPARPLSISLSYSGGYLNSTYLPEFFGTLNLHINRLVLFGGYQYWSAGAISIDGLIAGAKVFL